MADIVGLAQDFWDLAIDDAEFAAALAVRHKELLTSILDGSKVGDIITGSKNGASYTIRVTISVTELRSAISMTLSGLETGIRPGRISYNSFRAPSCPVAEA